MRIIFVWVSVVGVLSFSGCAAGPLRAPAFSVGALASTSRGVELPGDPHSPPPSEPIDKILERGAQIDLPAHVAVVQLDWCDPRIGSIPSAYVRVTSEEKNRLRKELTKTPHISRVTFMTEVGLSYQGKGTDLLALREAAATTGAELLLLLVNRIDTDYYFEPYGVSYFLLAPMLFVPANQYNVLSVRTALLIDVRSGHIYCEPEAEHTEKWSGSLAALNRDEVREQAKKKAMDGLLKELLYSLDIFDELSRK